MGDREFFGKVISCNAIDLPLTNDVDRDREQCMKDAVRFANESRSTYTDVQCEIDPVVENPGSTTSKVNIISVFCSGVKKSPEEIFKPGIKLFDDWFNLANTLKGLFTGG